jgi:hypothetical protein
MIRDSRYSGSEWFREHARSGDRVGYYGDPLKLPRLQAGVITMPMPGQTGPRPFPVDERTRPEFVIVVPVQPFEEHYEFTMPEHTYRSLVDGSMGYRRVAVLSGPALFKKRVVSFVNPTVQIFVRNDRWNEMIASGRALGGSPELR